MARRADLSGGDNTALDLMIIGELLIALLFGCILGAILLLFIISAKVPGIFVWLGKNTPIISVWSDGFGEIIAGVKKARSGLIFNLGSNNEIIDPAVLPEVKPSLRLAGRRVLIRYKGSSTASSVSEIAAVQGVLEHVDKNRDEYPLLSGLKDYEIMGAISHDPQTLRELAEKYCSVTKVVMVDGIEKELTDEEIKKAHGDKLKAYVAEADKLKVNCRFVPVREMFLDVARAVAATQLPITAFILKSYRREIAESVQSKQDGWDIGTIAIGACIGLAVGLILAKVLGL